MKTFKLWRYALGGLVLAWAPSIWAAAARSGFEASPYKRGLVLAVLVILPVPLVLIFALYRYIRSETKDNPPENE